MAAPARWKPADDGIAFERDDGSFFTLPATPETVAAAVQLDGQAGDLKPPETYGALLQGTGLGPQATGPAALADAAGAVAPPASIEHADPFAPKPSKADASRSQFFDSVPAGAGGAGGGGPAPLTPAEWAAEAGKATAAHEAKMAATLADINAFRVSKGLAPYVDGENGKLVEAKAVTTPPAAVDPAKVRTFQGGSGGAPSKGVSGSGGGDVADQLALEELERSRRGPVVIGHSKAGFSPQSKSVQGEVGPGAGTVADAAVASDYLVGQQEALARKDAGTLQGKIDAQDEAVARGQQLYNQALSGFKAADDDTARLRHEVETGKADPGQWWGDQGAWGQLVGALAIFAGAMGGALNGTNKNAALDVINKRIDDSIAQNLASKREALGAAERSFDLNIKRLGSLEHAVDYSRLQKHMLVDAQLAKNELDAKTDDERGNYGLLRAANNQRIAELTMKLDAAKNGVVNEAFKYNPGGAVYAPGYKPLTFEQRQSLRKELREGRKADIDERKTESEIAKNQREAGPQGAVYRGQDIELDGYDKEEGQKARKALSAADRLDALVRERDRLNTIGTRATFEDAAKLKETNAAIGAAISVIREMGVQGETERQEFDRKADSYLNGKGMSRALTDEVEGIRKSILKQGKAHVRLPDGSRQRIKVDD